MTAALQNPGMSRTRSLVPLPGGRKIPSPDGKARPGLATNVPNGARKKIVPLQPLSPKPPSSQGREKMGMSRRQEPVKTPVSGIDKKAPVWYQPWWLRSLTGIYSISSVTTILLGAATLTMYASTVYHQQQWSQEYGRLESLRREERQLSATNEVLKNNIAESAEQPNTGLVPPEAAPTIVLEPAPPSKSAAPKPTPTKMTPLVEEPLGY